MKRRKFPLSPEDINVFKELTRLDTARAVIASGSVLAEMELLAEQVTAEPMGILRPLALGPLSNIDRTALRYLGDIAALGTTPEQRMDNYLRKLRELPYGRWLFAHSQFKTAFKVFEEKLRSRGPNGYKATTYPVLTFLECSSLIGPYAWGLANKFTQPEPSKRDLEQARGRAKALDESFALGVRLDSLEDSRRLKELLTQLTSELDGKILRYRKPYGDTKRLGRQFVSTSVEMFLKRFGEVSPRIIGLFAEVVGYHVDSTNIEKQVRAARTTYRKRQVEQLAHALTRAVPP